MYLYRNKTSPQLELRSSSNVTLSLTNISIWFRQRRATHPPTKTARSDFGLESIDLFLLLNTQSRSSRFSQRAWRPLDSLVSPFLLFPKCQHSYSHLAESRQALTFLLPNYRVVWLHAMRPEPVSPRRYLTRLTLLDQSYYLK